LHQHAPPLADVCRSANDPIQGYEYVPSHGRAVHESGTERHVAIADFDTGKIGWNQGASNPELLLVPKQSVRIVDL
jgi:hypothetical protein